MVKDTGFPHPGDSVNSPENKDIYMGCAEAFQENKELTVIAGQT